MLREHARARAHTHIWYHTVYCAKAYSVHIRHCNLKIRLRYAMHNRNLLRIPETERAKTIKCND